MFSLRNYTIRARLYALAALAITAMLVIGVYGLLSQRQSREAFAHYVANEVEALTRLADIRAGAGNLRRYEKDLLINLGDGKATEKYHAEWIATYDKTVAGLGVIAKLDLPADLKRYPADLTESLGEYRRGFLAVAERASRHEFADTRSANGAMEPVKAPVRAVDRILAEMTLKIDKNSENTLAAIREQDRLIQLAFVFVLIGCVLLIGIFTALNIRSILRPLQEAADATLRIAEHDLRQAVPTSGRDETAVMMRGVQAMQDSLSAVVSGVRGATDSIATASREVAMGSHDLSQRTEQAASNLEETSSAMEQLTASVGHNAESSRQANQLAQDAALVARRGGEVVGDVVNTMGRISESSRKISDITAVIDGIAFQTNILALNAAVEAARAGEQGRGFAVVAAEVRNLAQRSAEAAKEIKSLITASSESVESGAQLVERAGDTMQEIVASIGRVSHIVSEISLASNEQSTGINQIGQAIANLDEMTQQNAALVEQSAAAAQSLQEQASALAQSVAVFKLA
ncbi:methyl-accepting chemotaxis protein [Paucibacter oligotrophus]|uniref:Methyl-accepting chemotaxis protein n=1 Tax=Roseateles oligotrophus TaxID=1769250 RepID=A0A840L7Q8_9BURK|nr:methyl-accepting chemotaxis protein [Roseateles oligotrophus]MBB4842258.1 methyl-accepting chemotaxis protein [Roseateles oligotrophus]